MYTDLLHKVKNKVTELISSDLLTDRTRNNLELYPASEGVTILYQHSPGRCLLSLSQNQVQLPLCPHDITERWKYKKKTNQTASLLRLHFLYHWLTDYSELNTYEQIRAAILSPALSPSAATIIAVNKYIQEQQPSVIQKKLLFKHSPWRWTKGPDNSYFPSTLWKNNRGISTFNNILNIPFISYLNREQENIEERIRQREAEIEAFQAREREAARNRVELLGSSSQATEFFSFKKGNNPNYQTFFGVELELEGFKPTEYTTLRILKDHAIFKRDGSLQAGVEICTAPATLDIHIKEFNNFFQEIQKNTSQLNVTERCGLHIHIDNRKDKQGHRKISNLHLANFYLFINNTVNQVEINKLAGRLPNNYCTRHEADYSYFTNKDKDKSKYRQVNLVPPDTVEIRMFASTTNINDFATRLEFTQALLNYSRPGETNLSPKNKLLWANFISYLKENKKYYPTLSTNLKLFTISPLSLKRNQNVQNISI